MRRSTALLRWWGPHLLTHFLTVTQSCLSDGGGHNQTISVTSATVRLCTKLPQFSSFVSVWQMHWWKSLIHLGAFVWFFHNVQRETSKLCLLPAPYTLTLASLRLFELQRDCSLLLPHGHFVWIVISYQPLFSFPAFFLPLITSHSVAFSE